MCDGVVNRRKARGILSRQRANERRCLQRRMPPGAARLIRRKACHTRGDLFRPMLYTRECARDFVAAPGINCVSRICQYLGIRHMLNRGWALIRTHAHLPMLKSRAYVESRLTLGKNSFAFAPGYSCVSRICQYLGFRHMLNRGWALISTCAHVLMLRCQAYRESRMGPDKNSCLFDRAVDSHPSATSAVGRRHFAHAEYERPQPGEASRGQQQECRRSIPHPSNVRGESARMRVWDGSTGTQRYSSS